MLAKLLPLLALPASLAFPLQKRVPLNPLDTTIVNLALNLENLELNLWGQALTNFTQEDFVSAGLGEDFAQGLALLRDQEVAHVGLLDATLDGTFTNCSYYFPVETPMDLVKYGQIVTSVGEGAYLGAIANITDPAVRQSAAQIIGNEARQNSYLRTKEGLNFFNAPNFDTPLTAGQAYSIASQYWNCPVGQNLPFNLSSIPPLTLEFTTSPNATTNSTSPQRRLPGDPITVTWNATEAFLGLDVFLLFLSDVNVVKASLNQTAETRMGMGMGTTTLPELVNGTTFVVATTFNGSGPIPDEFNYAIGPLVVA